MEGTNKLSEVLCDQKMWKVCKGWRWVEHWGAWFKVSDETMGPPAELSPVKGSYLPKSADIAMFKKSCKICYYMLAEIWWIYVGMDFLVVRLR